MLVVFNYYLHCLSSHTCKFFSFVLPVLVLLLTYSSHYQQICATVQILQYYLVPSFVWLHSGPSFCCLDFPNLFHGPTTFTHSLRVRLVICYLWMLLLIFSLFVRFLPGSSVLHIWRSSDISSLPFPLLF